MKRSRAKVLWRLARLWLEVPHMRFGQLVLTAAHDSGCTRDSENLQSTLWNWSDEDWQLALRALHFREVEVRRRMRAERQSWGREE